MKPAAAHAVLLRLVCMAGALLAGCASAPAPGTIVLREDTRTVWTTQEAEEAAKAAAAAEAQARRAAAQAAQARAPAARPPAAAAVPPPPAPAPTAKAAAALPAERLVQFEFDRYDVKEEFWALIEAYARWLSEDRNRRLSLEGHADERGGAEYNLALGQRRAEAVRQRLELLGVTPAQSEAISFGDTRPADPARNEEAYARNRRVELRPL